MTESSVLPFTLRLVTRGYELDPTGTVPMPVIFRFFEHKRWMMMRDERLGLVDLVHAGHFFVVRTQTIEIVRHIGQGVPLVLETRFLDAGRSVTSVRHTARRERDGALVAQARVRGVWIGPSRRMVRLPDELRAFARHQADEYHARPDATPAAVAGDAGRPGSFFDPPAVVHAPLGVDVEAADMTPPDDAFVYALTVPPRDLDVFSHVNAATWLRYVDDARILGAQAGALPAAHGAGAFNVRSALLYLNEAVVGDRLRVHVWPLEAAGPRSVAAAITREGSPDRLVCARVDVAPGARPIAPAT